MNEMARLAEQLPEGFDFEWTGISFEEQQAGGQVSALLGLSLIVVFLLLAALYESWTVPLAVLLIVPLGVLGAVLFTMLRGLPADVYFNVGLIAIIGLAAKNAILIIEFALEEEATGKSTFDATMNAVKLRLRPIIMTSLAFILGMVPLVLSAGAGAASRIAVGTGVMGGMIAATVLGVFFIPVLYMSVRRWLTRRPPGSPEKSEPPMTRALQHSHRIARQRSECCSVRARSRLATCGPTLPTAERYADSYVDDPAAGTRAIAFGWRDFFADPRLEVLIATALKNNRDLTIAVAQIEEARGLYRIQRSELLPTIAVSADATRNGAGPASAVAVGRRTPIGNERHLQSILSWAPVSRPSSWISGAGFAICRVPHAPSISPPSRRPEPFNFR